MTTLFKSLLSTVSKSSRSIHSSSSHSFPPRSVLRPGSLASLSDSSASLDDRPIAPRGTSSAAFMADTIENMELQAQADLDPNSDPSLLRNLGVNSVISPRSLSPQAILTPFPAKANLKLAYPLGVPRRLVPTTDIFHYLSLSPLAAPLNTFLRSQFTTSMGKIMNRSKTQLGRKNQRQMGKAVRRARSMGIIPMFGQSNPGDRDRTSSNNNGY